MDHRELAKLEDNAKKSLEMVAEINQLKVNLDAMEAVKEVKFFRYDKTMVFKSSIGDLTDYLKNDYVSRAEKRISQLENELRNLWNKEG